MGSRFAAVGCGIGVGFALALIAPWLLFNFRDTNILKVGP